MKRPQKRSKPKKKNATASVDKFDRDSLERMARDAKYRASPYHKTNPADWGLSGPPRHRPDKTVCEGFGITCSREAVELLKSSIRCGMISDQQRGNWPQNVWAVDSENTVYEAQLSNSGLGEYHGYPLKDGDRLADHVRTEWEKRSQ